LRAVLDPNAIISAALSPAGSPGRILRHWLEGAFDLVVSPFLLEKLDRALGYAKLQNRVSEEERRDLVDLLGRGAVTLPDPESPAVVRSPDPGDDYLIALADVSRAILVSGDSDLLGLADQIPVRSPAEFIAMIESTDVGGI
jgi:putative PIN family toxin of toxin-antitoxin system